MRSSVLLLSAISLFFIFNSCKESKVHTSFSQADSLVIHFKDRAGTQIEKTVETSAQKAISRMADFIDAPATQMFKCGFNGKMFFFKNDNLVQEVDFQYELEECRHFVFMLEGKLMSTRMNNEATDFLDALKRGLPVYY